MKRPRFHLVFPSKQLRDKAQERADKGTRGNLTEYLLRLIERDLAEPKK